VTRGAQRTEAAGCGNQFAKATVAVLEAVNRILVGR
jgi:hypothetical protein